MVLKFLYKTVQGIEFELLKKNHPGTWHRINELEQNYQQIEAGWIVNIVL